MLINNKVNLPIFALNHILSRKIGALSVSRGIVRRRRRDCYYHQRNPSLSIRHGFPLHISLVPDGWLGGTAGIAVYALGFPRFLRMESPRISMRWAL